MLAVNKKRVNLLALLALVGAGFSSLDHSGLIPLRQASAQTEVTPASGKKAETGKKAKTRDKKKAEQKLDEESMFLKDNEKASDYVPEIYRCPECGYEQDEPGNCPDHNTLELVKILSPGKDPLEPAELDGNEDILVDIPLKNIQFKKADEVPEASASAEIKESPTGN